MRKLTALSFFTGAMGLDLGLAKAGIETVLACEIDKATVATIRANHPTLPVIGDIREHSAREILEIAGVLSGKDVDLIVGGPPCQAFSSAGKRLGFHDERGNVFLTFIERILEIRPKYAVIENVRGLLSAPISHRPHAMRGRQYPPLAPLEQPGGALRLVIGMLRQEGYGISFNLYDAANFGTPQRRERVILVCARDGSELPYLTPTHAENGDFGLKKWVTVREAIADLEGTEHEFIPFPEKRLKYFRMLRAGQNWRDLPKELQQEALGKSYYAGGGKTGFLRRVPWDKPSPTLVTHPAMPATDLCHPERDRPLSVQEYMRLQQFPDNWILMGRTIDKYRQLGNAVPVSLGRAIGELILKHSQGCESTPQFPGFPYSRYKRTSHKEWEADIERRLQHLPLEQPALFG